MNEKFRDSDVELRNSASGNELAEGSRKIPKTYSTNLRALLIGGIAFSGAVFIAIIVTYFVVYDTVDSQVKSISEVRF